MFFIPNVDKLMQFVGSFPINVDKTGEFVDILYLIKLKAVLKHIVDFEHNVDWSGRRETPAGAAGQVRPRRRFSAEEAHRPRLERKSTFIINRAKLKDG
ncbi:hypothetical protein ACFVSW_05825 [Neobacillus sp. NPDC058068]|uniref:hypothetical protein n=1 Tax=Neobacillus sp. NPDC058068 TaxID=3346325 RepID=UPI0036DC8FB8